MGIKNEPSFKEVFWQMFSPNEVKMGVGRGYIFQGITYMMVCFKCGKTDPYPKANCQWCGHDPNKEHEDD